MPNITPTFQNQRWGESPSSMFEYYQHSVRDKVTAAHPQGQNPLIISRHPGAGNTGDHTFQRLVSTGRISSFLRWLQSPNNGLSTHFDYCTITSGQRNYTGSFYPIGRGRSTYFPEAIRDCQRAIASIKHLHNTYGFDPERVSGFGDSHGSTLLGLGVLAPPLLASGPDVWIEGSSRYGTHDSTLKSLIYHDGQVDARKADWGDGAGTVDYLSFANYSHWFGVDQQTDLDTFPTELREAASIKKYLELGAVANYVPFFTVYQGLSLVTAHPWTNPHDDRQLTELNNLLQSNGLTFGTHLYPISGLTVTLDGSNYVSVATGSEAETLFNKMYNHLVAYS